MTSVELVERSLTDGLDGDQVDYDTKDRAAFATRIVKTLVFEVGPNVRVTIEEIP